MAFWKKLKKGKIWKRIFLERLTEPLHLNFISALVAAFGSFRAKVAFDLVVRQHNAYSILRAADFARQHGVKEICMLEFGVAAGAGLMNMATIARRVTRATGVKIKIYGFDTGTGMPPAQSYKDHPEHYQEGDFKMDFEGLKKRLPDNAELILGDVEKTVPDFLGTLSASCPIGFVVIDVDYYSSTKATLPIFEGKPECYLPVTVVYLDDIMYAEHNSWCGELLAINEFNEEHELRKIEHQVFLENERIFRKAPWIKHVWYCQVLDHPLRNDLSVHRASENLANPYMAKDGAAPAE